MLILEDVRLWASILIIIGAVLLILGGLLNKLVVIYNQGKMPVLCKNIKMWKYLEHQNNQNLEHCVLRKSARLKCLADKYEIGNGIYSVGDFIMCSGILLFIISVIVTIIIVVSCILFQVDLKME